MTKRNLLLLVAACACTGPSLAAQRPAPNPLTLAEAVALARRANPLARAAGGRRQIVEGRARAEAAQPNPVVELRRENTRSALPFDDFVTVTLPTDLTGRRAALRSVARSAGTRGAADSVLAIRQVEVDAAHAWVRQALLRGLAEVATDQRLALERIASFDATRLAEGAIAEATAVRGRLEADRARLAAAQATSDAIRARQELARAVGHDVADGELPEAGPLPPLTTGAALPGETEAVARALEARADVGAARAALAEARSRERAELLGILPDVGVQAGYKGTAGVATAVVGLTLTAPIIHWNGGARERATGERRIAEAELRDLEARVRAEVCAALQSVAAMRTAVQAIGPDLETRAAVVSTSAEAAYREGATSQLEVLEAQRARAEARVTALRAAADLLLAQLELNRALGAPILEDR